MAPRFKPYRKDSCQSQLFATNVDEPVDAGQDDPLLSEPLNHALKCSPRT